MKSSVRQGVAQPLIDDHPLSHEESLPSYIPHRPERPEKSEGGVPFKIQSEFEPKGDQPQAICELVDGLKRSRKFSGIAWRDRYGQNLHHGPCYRGHAAPCPHSCAE